jgi:inorganic pyrophosphatase
VQKGANKCHSFGLFFQHGDKTVSPWHYIEPQIPHESSVVSFVNEIGRGGVEKMEVKTKELHNPIRQDKNKKDGSLRNYTFGEIPFNYGMVPRTWESTTVADKYTKVIGDGDPLDACEIAPATMHVGAVAPVKVLGCIALIDEGETDWKLVTIRADHPWASAYNDVADLEKAFPNITSSIRNWWRFYKTTDGKPVNKFAFDGQFLGRDFAMDVVGQSRGHYDNMRRDPKLSAAFHVQ